MSVSCQGVRSGRSSPHVNAVSMTAASGAQRRRCRDRRTTCRPAPMRKPNSDSSHRTVRPTTFAYGSITTLLGLKRWPAVRRVGPVHAVAVQLSGTHVRQIAVPDHVGLLRQRDRQRFRFVVRGIEQAQLDAGRVLRENREVHARRRPRSRPSGYGAPGQTRITRFGTRTIIADCRLRSTADRARWRVSCPPMPRIQQGESWIPIQRLAR